MERRRVLLRQVMEAIAGARGRAHLHGTESKFAKALVADPELSSDDDVRVFAHVAARAVVAGIFHDGHHTEHLKLVFDFTSRLCSAMPGFDRSAPHFSVCVFGGLDEAALDTADVSTLRDKIVRYICDAGVAAEATERIPNPEHRYEAIDTLLGASEPLPPVPSEVHTAPARRKKGDVPAAEVTAEAHTAPARRKKREAPAAHPGARRSTDVEKSPTVESSGRFLETLDAVVSRLPRLLNEENSHLRRERPTRPDEPGVVAEVVNAIVPFLPEAVLTPDGVIGLRELTEAFYRAGDTSPFEIWELTGAFDRNSGARLVALVLECARFVPV